MLPENDTLGKLADALIEHQPDDPDLGDPGSWPEWTDDVVVAVGGPRGRDETFDDASGYDPTEEEWKYFYDLLERDEYERGCQIRFA